MPFRCRNKHETIEDCDCFVAIACRWFFLLPILTAREYSSWEAASLGLKRSNRWMILVGSLWIMCRFFTCRSLQSWTRTIRQPEVSRTGCIEPEGCNNSRYYMIYDMDWYGTIMSRFPTSAQSGQRSHYCFTCSNPRRPWRKSCVGKDAGSPERPWTCLRSLESLRDVKSGTKYVTQPSYLRTKSSSCQPFFSFSIAVLHKLSCTSPWSPLSDAAPAS